MDFSLTINTFTELAHAYCLPTKFDLNTKIAKHKVFSTIDSRSAYHQIPILESNKPNTAFEACRNLRHFLRIPLSIANGVAPF